MFKADLIVKEKEYQLIRELDPNNKKDVNEAYRNGRNLSIYNRVGKYKDRSGFIYYFNM